MPPPPITQDASIRPFRANVPDDVVADMRRRLQATRWPDKETVSDRSQGAQLERLQELVHHWATDATDYDWRNGEAKLNTFPQFMTTFDGVDIHFIHVRSRHANALPMIIRTEEPEMFGRELRDAFRSLRSRDERPEGRQ